jgi:hypothetical protein
MGDPKKATKDLAAGLDALVGVAQSVDQQASADSLNDAGIDREDLHARMLNRLKEEAKPYWIAQKPLPPLLEAALSQFKATAGKSAAPAALREKATSRLLGILDGARSTLTGKELPEFCAAFRNSSPERLEDDKETIADLERELFRELERERDGD